MDDFLLITPLRSTIPLHENQKRFDQIPKLAQSLLQTQRVDAYWLVGHWSGEPDISGQASWSSEPEASERIDCLEYSWFLVKRNPQINSRDSLLAATLLADQYAQCGYHPSRG